MTREEAMNMSNEQAMFALDKAIEALSADRRREDVKNDKFEGHRQPRGHKTVDGVAKR